ncbi:hypothetical protein [Lactobacillus corticis]|uniref:DUF5590 domain-containing protein n=1 Tax=Lactobacillus corticis TaxID=2201249 RepID=A0A916VI80_9LACO|nr:hypothetical protein [Lactobacillus corticis]GFZ27028.1 hypothetical protein LCB40_09080 [Lactobacillus corticis]
MSRYGNRRWTKFILWLIAILLLLWIAYTVIFYFAGADRRGNQAAAASVAESKSGITNVQKYYHLDRGVSSYSLKGTNKSGKTFYFIYLPHSKKAYVYPASKGTSEKNIRQKFTSQTKSATIRDINLGWYKGQAVWEVSYNTSQNKLGYAIYTFNDGNRISDVANL